MAGILVIINCNPSTMKWSKTSPFARDTRSSSHLIYTPSTTITSILIYRRSRIFIFNPFSLHLFLSTDFHIYKSFSMYYDYTKSQSPTYSFYHTDWDSKNAIPYTYIHTIPFESVQFNESKKKYRMKKMKLKYSLFISVHLVRPHSMRL